MTAMTQYQDFAEQVGKKQHNLDTDTFRVWLSNTAPTATDTTFPGTATDLSTAGGYTAGGEDIQNAYTESGGVGTMTAVDYTWTATAAGIGPFQYVGIYNDTNSTNMVGPGYYALASPITLAEGEKFTVNFGASLLTIGPP